MNRSYMLALALLTASAACRSTPCPELPPPPHEEGEAGGTGHTLNDTDIVIRPYDPTIVSNLEIVHKLNSGAVELTLTSNMKDIDLWPPSIGDAKVELQDNTAYKVVLSNYQANPTNDPAKEVILTITEASGSPVLFGPEEVTSLGTYDQLAPPRPFVYASGTEPGKAVVWVSYRAVSVPLRIYAK